MRVYGATIPGVDLVDWVDKMVWELSKERADDTGSAVPCMRNDVRIPRGSE